MRLSPFHARHQAFAAALQQLRDGRVGESAYGRRIALLLTIPTFDDPVARDIRRAATGELYVVRTVWRRALDLASAPRPLPMPGPVRALALPSLEKILVGRPTFVATRVDVDVDALDSLLASLATTTLPCRIQQPEPALDATIFEVTFGDELTETRYRWTADPPDGWAPLATFSSMLIRLIDEPAGVPTR